MVAFTGFSNDGYNTLANSLSGLGNTLGNAYLKNQERELERQRLSDLGLKIQSGDLANAANSAFQFGDMATGVSLLKLKQDQDKQKAVLEADRNALSPFNTGTNNSTVPMDLAGATPGMDEVSSYIVQSARARGIDPNVALQVAKSEGLGKYTGDGGSSFGPFQLHYGGIAKGGNSVPGMGDDFTKATGLDARDPRTVKQQIDFALDRAKTGGWSPWHGWKGDPMAGIGQGAPVQVADASGAIPQSANVDGLLAKRANIMQRLSMQGISDNARQQLATQLKDTEFMIQRADNKAAVVPEFQKKNEAKMADRFDALVNEGDSARGEIALVDQLDGLGRSFDTGGAAAAQAWLADKGINVGSNVDKIQAYQAIVNKLVPMQRAPGSGSTSDFDARGFMASLPGLMKTPEGNQRIIDTLKGLAQYKIERGIVAEKVQLGEMSANEGVRALREIKASSFIKPIPQQTQGKGFNVKQSDQIAGSQPTMQSDSFQKSGSNVPQGFNSDFTDYQRAVSLHPERKDEFLSRLAQKYKNFPEVLSQIQ